MITEKQFKQARRLVKKRSNEINEYITFTLEISCHGLRDIKVYKDEFDESEPILRPSNASVSFGVYHENAKHEQNFETFEAAMTYIKTIKNRNRRVKNRMMEAQIAAAESV